jgi:hypothetical protein
MTATGKCYPYLRVITETRVNFTPCKGNNLTTRHTRAKRASRVATVHDDYQRVEPGPPYPSAHLSCVCLSGYTVSAHALFLLSSMRYGRVSSNSMTDEGSMFARPQKIPYAPVHNSNFLTGARRFVLNRHRWGLLPQSSKHENWPLPDLLIRYSSLSPNCPARSHIKPFYQLIIFSNHSSHEPGYKKP